MVRTSAITSANGVAMLSELQNERPEAELIAVEGDWAWVSIGTVNPCPRQRRFRSGRGPRYPPNSDQFPRTVDGPTVS